MPCYGFTKFSPSEESHAEKFVGCCVVKYKNVARGFVTALVAEHWLHQPGVLNLISGFLLLFCLNCPIHLSCINAPISVSQMFCFTLDWCAENFRNSHVQLMLVHNFNMLHQQFLCCILSGAYKVPF